MPSLAAHYAAFLPEAMKLAQEQVQGLRVDVALVYTNVEAGVQAVQRHLSRLKTALPEIDVGRFATLPALASALIYATEQAVRLSQPVRKAEIDAKMARLSALREPMLVIAEGLALLGILPQDRVARIRSGRGPFDVAQDGVALADLYTEYKGKLAGKQPFSEAQIAEAAQLGQELMRLITPAGGRAPANPEAERATEARDRLYTLLVLRHAELRKAGFYLFGEEVNERVPTLGARGGTRRRTEPEADPAPVPAPPAAGPTPAPGPRDGSPGTP